MTSPFSRRMRFGKQGQDILINFLERHFGYKFEAGERYDSILNVDLIEEIEGCEFIPPDIKKSRGARLKFKRGSQEKILTMPDVLMSRNSQNGFYWIEAKRHTKDRPNLSIDKESFLDYKTLYLEFTRQEFYVMCLNPNEYEESWDVYFCEFGTLLKKNPVEEVLNGNSVLSWDMGSTMEKLNRYPIKIEKYE